MEQLTANPLTIAVDVARKEEYLDDATFLAKFNLSKTAFAALPKWKRDEAKKKVGLF
jgi:hypothetical protein